MHTARHILALTALALALSPSVGADDAHAQEITTQKQKIKGTAGPVPGTKRTVQRVTRSDAARRRAKILSLGRAVDALSEGGKVTVELASRSCTMRVKPALAQQGDTVDMTRVVTVSAAEEGVTLTCAPGVDCAVDRGLAGENEERSYALRATAPAKVSRLADALRDLVTQCHAHAGKPAPKLD